MPVISPRRSSTTTSATGSLYGTTAATSSGSTASGLGGSSKYGTSSSYFDRASSLSKVLPNSRDYSSSYSYLNSSSSSSSYTPSSSSSSASAYIPRTSAYRSPSSASSYLSGGSSALSSYRPSSYLSTTSNYDTSSIGRYGLKKNATEDERQHNSSGGGKSTATTSVAAKRPPTGSSANDTSAGKTTDNKRLTNSSSSSSLARLVATCGLDLYEKYSPAHYKPNCELSRSRSAVNNDSASNTESTTVAKEKNDTSNTTKASSYASLDRPRSRYSRLYSNSSDTSDAPAENLGNFRSSLRERPSSRLPPTGLSTSESAGEIPTATFTLRSSRAKKKTANDDSTVADNAVVKNGSSSAIALTDHKTTNGIDDTSSKLDDLKLGTTPTSTAHTADELTTNNNHNNNDKNGSLDEDGDVSTSVSIKLDTQSNKSKSPVKVIRC